MSSNCHQPGKKKDKKSPKLRVSEISYEAALVLTHPVNILSASVCIQLQIESGSHVWHDIFLLSQFSYNSFASELPRILTKYESSLLELDITYFLGTIACPSISLLDGKISFEYFFKSIDISAMQITRYFQGNMPSPPTYLLDKRYLRALFQVRKRCFQGNISSPSTFLLDVPESHRRWSTVPTGEV